MTNKQINQLLRAFHKSRQGWMESLDNNPESIQAAQHILSINSKCELLRTLWNWSDESVEPFYP